MVLYVLIGTLQTAHECSHVTLAGCVHDPASLGRRMQSLFAIAIAIAVVSIFVPCISSLSNYAYYEFTNRHTNANRQPLTSSFQRLFVVIIVIVIAIVVAVVVFTTSLLLRLHVLDVPFESARFQHLYALRGHA